MTSVIYWLYPINDGLVYQARRGKLKFYILYDSYKV